MMIWVLKEKRTNKMSLPTYQTSAEEQKPSLQIYFSLVVEIWGQGRLFESYFAQNICKNWFLLHRHLFFVSPWCPSTSGRRPQSSSVFGQIWWPVLAQTLNAPDWTLFQCIKKCNKLHALVNKTFNSVILEESILVCCIITPCWQSINRDGNQRKSSAKDQQIPFQLLAWEHRYECDSTYLNSGSAFFLSTFHRLI